MGEFSVMRKTASFGCLIAGLVLMIWGLAMAIGKTGNTLRGGALVVGAVLFFAGLYLFPTFKHHRTIVNIIFLFPLLFAFAVTVIIPLVLGIGYSFTDWNGIKMKGFVGMANYTRMFKQPGFIWSILITFLFVVFNIILVNLVAFLLALLCTSKIKGLGFFRAYRRNRSGLYLAVHILECYHEVHDGAV